jgi:hypothetical protein
MRAVITSLNRETGNYQARTDNEIALAFGVRDGQHFDLNEYIEVDLPNLIAVQSVIRVSSGHAVAVELHTNDIHDLRLRSGHGTNRFPSPERLAEA